MTNMSQLASDLLSASQHSDTTSVQQAEKPTIQAEAVNAFLALEQERQHWEGTVFADSRRALYQLLAQCYAIHFEIVDGPNHEHREAWENALAEMLKRGNHKVLSSSTIMHQVIKVVFGVERRRVSAYATALNVALTSGPIDESTGKPTPIAVPDLVSWIEAQGGIEEVRAAVNADSKTSSASATDDAARAWVNSCDLGVVTLEQHDLNTDGGKLVVMLASVDGASSYRVHQVLADDAAVLSALRKAYKQHVKNADSNIISMPNKAQNTNSSSSQNTAQNQKTLRVIRERMARIGAM